MLGDKSYAARDVTPEVPDPGEMLAAMAERIEMFQSVV